jgi:PAS domain S-box-containing protein
VERLDCEYRVKHADGSYRWLEDRAVPVRNAAGRAIRLVGAVTDVTARKESEHALREALEQQTATTEVLQVINSSPGNLTPVFDAMLEKAMRLCGASFGQLDTYDGRAFHTAATRGVPAAFAEYRSRNPVAYGAGTGPVRMLAGERVVYHVDLMDDDVYRRGEPNRRALVNLGGARSSVQVALRKDDAFLGFMTLFRQQVRPFTQKQGALLQNFAAQAVIAMDNARLLSELRERTDELTESLDYQTATSEVLNVISRSTEDMQPVLDAMVTAAARLCAAQTGGIAVRRGDHIHFLATVGQTPEFERHLLTTAYTIDRRTAVGRAVLERAIYHSPDIAADPSYGAREASTIGRQRAVLGVPLMLQGEAVGVIIVSRAEPQPFTERQIGLVKTFADQAVIAMENTRLLSELRLRTDDLAESLEYQTATSELLEIISRSTNDVQPVLDTVLASAGRLCETTSGAVAIRGGDVFRQVASMGVSSELAEMIRSQVYRIDGSTAIGRVALSKAVVHIADAQADQNYSSPTTDAGGIRTVLGVPLVREGEVIGVIVLVRDRVHPFSERQISLVKTFADQAVIAMENARLLSELTQREEELRVTFDNMGDGVAMFDAEPRLVAWNRNFVEIIGLPDALLAERPSYADYLRMLAERGEFGTENVEAELASRLEDTARELRLERTRADGTVIEVRRNAVPGGGFVLIYSDVTEQRQAEAAIRAARDDAEAALERQTATADILKVIASSPTDVQPVLEAVAQAAVRFCGAADSVVILRESDEAVVAAHEGPLLMPPGTSFPLNLETASGRAILGAQTCHFPDIPSLDRIEFAANHRIAAAQGFRAAVSAPLLRKGTAIGSVALRKPEVGPFAPQQIALLETFAAQAVIAIENVRLFTELRESLEQQTATAEILTVISQSPTDVGPVLSAVARAAMKFCGANDAQVSLREGDEWFIAAHEGPIETILGTRRMLTRHTALGRAMTDGEVIEIVDLQSIDADEFPEGRALGALRGFRSALAAPLLRDDVSIGAISLRRRDAGQFEPRQVELLKTFAAQAVIAIENVRLFTELRESLERLKAAQANLIQAEKMASLGQLTAGIAHEIKNPLNFVNNFAGLSVELLDELKQAVDTLLAEPDEDKRAELQETMDLLTGNLAKIVEHGRRADGIVKSMLAHSRGGTGDWQVSNINALVDEALNLAYHGARAQDQDFNVMLERDFAETKAIEVVPQDVTRVFLNLFGNGFYAANKRQFGGAGSDYRPTLTVSTRDLGDAVEVKVRDNGTGIPPEVRAKLFQPFFTTKPTGEGTGLGLSISYDIVTQQHGGSIDVESESGAFTEFTVRLPRRRRAA